jgi:hypothetical protein
MAANSIALAAAAVVTDDEASAAPTTSTSCRRRCRRLAGVGSNIIIGTESRDCGVGVEFVRFIPLQ